MPVFVALLRGVNVSGKKPMRMADLKELFGRLGYRDAQTCIQSGNVVFRAAGRSATLAKAITAAVRSSFGFDVAVMVRTVAELDRALAGNPFPDEWAPRTCFTFLEKPPPAAAVKGLLSMAFAPEEIRIRGSMAYGYYPLGAGKAKLNNNFLESKLRVRATSRNLRTVQRLVEMARAAG